MGEVQRSAEPAVRAASHPARPVPIGMFPLPFGYLLIDGAADDPGVEAARSALVGGRFPATWPAALRGQELACSGDVAGALAAFDGDGRPDESPEVRYNRFVLDPDRVDDEGVARLRDDLAAVAGLGVLVDLVAYTLGRSDRPPDPTGLDGELLALALAARAADDVDAGRSAAAVTALEAAVAAAAPVIPALAGVLGGALGQVLHASGAPPEQIEAVLSASIDRLQGTDLRVAIAEQELELALTIHESAADRLDRLNLAVHHYHNAIQQVSAESAPELFAAAHANLAAAYLTMPMVEASDHLRLGVAVGSLRAALEVYRPDTHPEQWSSAQLNLANSLVYAPSTRQGDNLVEAVELYETVLATRDRDRDPLGYARVLTNQANVLAHLGMFDAAWGKLVESRFIFEEFHEYDAATSVRGLLDEIQRHRTPDRAEA